MGTAPTEDERDRRRAYGVATGRCGDGAHPPIVADRSVHLTAQPTSRSTLVWQRVSTTSNAMPAPIPMPPASASASDRVRASDRPIAPHLDLGVARLP